MQSTVRTLGVVGPHPAIEASHQRGQRRRGAGRLGPAAVVTRPIGPAGRPGHERVGDRAVQALHLALFVWRVRCARWAWRQSPRPDAHRVARRPRRWPSAASSLERQPPAPPRCRAAVKDRAVAPLARDTPSTTRRRATGASTKIRPGARARVDLEQKDARGPPKQVRRSAIHAGPVQHRSAPRHRR
jgi:hypothetical protein